jgi:hypothetical protein
MLCHPITYVPQGVFCYPVTCICTHSHQAWSSPCCLIRHGNRHVLSSYYLGASRCFFVILLPVSALILIRHGAALAAPSVVAIGMFCHPITYVPLDIFCYPVTCIWTHSHQAWSSPCRLIRHGNRHVLSSYYLCTSRCVLLSCYLYLHSFSSGMEQPLPPHPSWQ